MNLEKTDEINMLGSSKLKMKQISCYKKRQESKIMNTQKDPSFLV